jgi:hypothetical protein
VLLQVRLRVRHLTAHQQRSSICGASARTDNLTDRITRQTGLSKPASDQQRPYAGITT